MIHFSVKTLNILKKNSPLILFRVDIQKYIGVQGKVNNLQNEDNEGVMIYKPAVGS